jgi:cytochrome o ubiquinol oxidase operon protein cyoD
MAKHESEFDLDTGATYGTHKSYAKGFILSLILTLISFYLVSSGAFSTAHLYIAVGILALIQLFVQLVFFLHLSTHSKASWNLLSFLFTLVMVLIFVLGTLWIMYNLYANMGMNTMSM